MTTLIKTQRSFLKSYDLDEDDIKIIRECVLDIKNKLLHHPSIIVYGRVAYQRRNIGFFSDESIGYYYSGKLMKSQPLSLSLKKLLDRVNIIFNSSFNGILINEYQDGNDYIGKHSDDETNLDSDVGVIAISYGAPRKFRIRNKSDGKIVKDILTKPNKIIQMGGDFQKEFTHEIPVEKRVKESRISFTFRHHNQ